MKQYKCLLCGWVYNPENGDKTQNIPPGTCPYCGSDKTMFRPVE